MEGPSRSCKGDYMISVREFHEQWSERHDFEYDDSDLLSKKYSNISFKDIPQAWVCCIFDHLSSIKDISKIVSVSQIMGFPVIQYENNIGDVEFDIIKDLERSLECIDIDLHKQLDAIILN
jgi:hypothetical protein